MRAGKYCQQRVNDFLVQHQQLLCSDTATKAFIVPQAPEDTNLPPQSVVSDPPLSVKACIEISPVLSAAMPTELTKEISPLILVKQKPLSSVSYLMQAIEDLRTSFLRLKKTLQVEFANRGGSGK
ncbi:unnamed protein product [Ceratitis capitata]|uniref:(Mediterranean fruit fly) hypothetical protein n=1 Tax=Ceratitis capitata TaxID=7213 RepID=A0A811VBU4_CERCA|nr:unnamed protein product [Ceratitis capitata]